jgi:acyl-CoA synthetase (AMP-forming)/AMP-acid ligase II
VPVPLYPPVRLGRLDEYLQATGRMLAACGARLLVSDTRLLRLLGRAVALAAPPLGCLDAARLQPTATDPTPAAAPGGPEIAADALALIQFSSGSTVAPKPVALSHRNLLAQCAALAATLPERAGEIQTGVSWLPLYHDMGLIGCLLSAVYYCGRLVLLSPEHFLARPALWLRAIGRHRADISPAPNFAYSLAAQRIRDVDLDGVRLDSWRYALNGAEPVSAATLEAFAARFSPFGFSAGALMPVYGLSEASLAVTFSAPGRGARCVSVDPAVLAARGERVPGERRLVSVGTPVPGFRIEVCDDRGRACAEGRVGRIRVQGPSVMQGYFGDPAATRRALQQGWLDTGDLGFIWEGELFISGRAKDVIVLRGANYMPQLFEESVHGVRGVRTGCVAALGSVETDGSEALLILAERAAAADPAQDDRLAARIAETVAAATGIRPHRVQLLAPGTLPRTSSGKLRRGEALRRLQLGTLRPPRRVGPLLLLGEALRSLWAYLRLPRRLAGAEGSAPELPGVP